MRVLVACALAGCGFGAPAAQDQPTGDDAAAAEAQADAAIDGSISECKRWSADFGSDPTAAGQWHERSDQAFPVDQLVGGVWESPQSFDPLDSLPHDAFDGHTIIDARLKCRQQSVAACAIVWVNVGYGDGAITGIYLDVHLEGGNQAVLLMQRNDGGTNIQLARAVVNSNDFVDAKVTISIANHMARLEVPGADQPDVTKAFIEQLPTDAGDMASVFPAAASSFDSVDVRSCPE